MEKTKVTPKRLLSLLLAIVMLLGMLPTAAFAADATTPVAVDFAQSKMTVDLQVSISYDGGAVRPGDSVPVTANWSFKTNNDNTVKFIISSFEIGGTRLTDAQREYDKDNDNVNRDGSKDGYKFASGTLQTSATADIYGVLWAEVKATAKRYYKDVVTKDDEQTYSGHAKLTGVELSHYQITYEQGTNMPTGTTVLGETMPVSTLQPKDESYTTEVPVYDASDYTFGGWRGSDNVIYNTYGENTSITVDKNMTLTAIWDKNAEVSYDDGGFSGVSGVPLWTLRLKSTGRHYTIPATYIPRLDGYKFTGWKASMGVETEDVYQPGDTITDVKPGDDLILSAQWEPLESTDNMTVTFDVGVANAGPVPTPQTVKKGEYATQPTNPVRDNWDFEYWYLNDETKAFDFTKDTVESDIVLHAKWKRQTVTITWVGDGADGVENFENGGYDKEGAKTTTVNKGDTVTFKVIWSDAYVPATVATDKGPLAPTISRDGDRTWYVYSFVADSNTTVTISDSVKKTFTITLPNGYGYSATFADCMKEDGTTLTAANGKASYTFEYGDTFKIDFEVYPDVEATLYVDSESYTVDGNGENPSLTVGVEKGYRVDHAYNISASIKQTVTRSVTFRLDQVGQVYSVQNVTHGDTATQPATPKIPGYKFIGWYADANFQTEWNFATAIRKDTIIYGKLEAETYNITFNPNPPTGKATTDVSNMPDNGNKTYGLVYQIPDKTPVLAGYTFKGWSTSADGAPVYQPGEAYVADMSVTLYAVWERITHTITLSAGEGYSIHHDGSLTVGDGESFTFRVAVAKGNEQYLPSVWADITGRKSINLTDSYTGSRTDKQTGMLVYTYTVDNITGDTAINVMASHNDVYTVKFVAVKGGTPESDPFLTQRIAWNEYAEQPLAPEREGYTFKGYYKEAVGTTKFDFATEQITNDTTVYAIYEAITPKIIIATPTGDGWTLSDWSYGESTGKEKPATVENNQFTIPYGNSVTFKLTVAAGYDYSQLSVSANGYALGYTSIKTDENGVTTIEYYLGYVTGDTRISVSGIERKTITVTYNENALDHVSNLPGPQTANYYLKGKTNTNFTTTKPVRTGYTFLGWSRNGTDTTPEFKWEDINSANGVAIPFIEDTTVYAIWEAETLTVTEFSFGGTALHTQNYDIQYEGKTFTLNAKLSAHAKGTATFYVGTKADKSDAVKLGEVTVNGDSASWSTSADKYVTEADQHLKYYWVEFKSESNEGYTDCEAGHIALKIFSRAITWSPLVDGNENTLTITQNGTPKDNMIAGQTYTLTVNIGRVAGLEALDSDKPVFGKDYKIVWQYRKTATSDWETVPGEFTDTNQYQVTPEESGYEFRAKVYPMGELYNKAAKFDANGTFVDNEYDVCLYTNTTESILEQTAITLTSDAPNEDASVLVNGETPFAAIAAHTAQFEGQTITLTAKVTKQDTAKSAVASGSVEFYQKKNGTWTLIATVPVQAEGTNAGVATAEATMSAYSGTATEAKDEFYAKYVPNATYAGSETDQTAPLTVYIKSAKLMTPVIGSKLEGKLNDTAKTPEDNTYYNYDLTELLAGVEHTFTLRQTGAAVTADAQYSVVALDGRSVDAGDYTIEWIVKTGDNEETNAATGATFTTKDNKNGDYVYVKLVGKNNMTNEAASRKAMIGTKQGVIVKVEAIDVISATEVDRPNKSYPDVYQLNDIELTATVEAADTNATMLPDGTVAFYYVDEADAFQKLGEAELEKSTDGKMVAKITTNKLPVETKNGKNTYLTSEITAVYFGNETFLPSENWDATSEVKTGTYNSVETDHVTVYSSVVYNCMDENKKGVTTGEVEGIHISLSDGTFKVHEKATLQLSDVYTLDKQVLSAPLRESIAKLDPNKDYTVQWQKLEGATAIGDADGTSFAGSKRWTDIEGAVGTTLVLDEVGQDTAYRAVITVKDPATAIVKGSFELVNQTVKGRQVYYSNVMMPTDGSATISVAIESDVHGANEEGVTEGETVTVNVLISGAVGSVPNAEVTVIIKADETKGNNTGYVKTFTNKNTVNGWNAFAWNTAEKDDNGKDTLPGFYTMTVSAKSNTGYIAKDITRSIIVRESSYSIVPSETTVTYNGQTQGLKVTLDGFDFNGDAINEAANKSWTVTYEDAAGNQVEPSQAGTYTATITLPGSAYWTKEVRVTKFTIEKRQVSIADAVAQAKVYDNSTKVNIVEVMLNDAATAQTTTGLPTENTGVINGDSVYAVVAENGATLGSKNAGGNSFKITKIALKGDDAANYKWDEAPYTEDIYVSRSQVYGEAGALELKKGEAFPADKVIKMIDQAGNKLELDEDYTLTFYYHSDTEIKVNKLDKTGLYTVVARPNQANYKSGVTMQFHVIDGETTYTEAATPKASTLITISNTAELYGKATGAVAKNAQGKDVKVEYQDVTSSTGWSDTIPANAGRYLLRATDTDTGDVAYGIYTITKAHPSITFEPVSVEYDSTPHSGYQNAKVNGETDSTAYFTYAGDVAIGYNVPAEGNVAEESPVDAGTYTITMHANESANYTAHEVSKTFTISKKALTIKADSWTTTHYDAFPDMTATYTGLAAVAGDSTPDTSLRDVQIAPEFLYNPKDGKSNYSNDAHDQVGTYPIQPIDALSKNYAITYVNGQFTKTEDPSNPDLTILGLPQSSTGKNTVYFGDVIQLYPYGYYTTHANGSSELTWSVSNNGVATIDKDLGILTVTGVGTFTVTLTRGATEAGKTELTISTTVEVTARKKEAKIAMRDVDRVYSGEDQTYVYTGNVTVYDELYKEISNFNDTKVTLAKNSRTDVGTQLPTAKINDNAWAYQSETYGGQFTINDKDATVEPGAQRTVYGTTETFDANPTWTVDGTVGSVAPVSNVKVASQTDAYNRLDVHNGYEILVAGTENINYNVKYVTDPTDKDSEVTTYGGVKFTSKTVEELNDATVYGETPNVLDWGLTGTKFSTRSGKDYADNLADFDLPTTFVYQDKDDCVLNAKTYKAANRTTDTSNSSSIKYNQDVLNPKGGRTATDTEKDENYTLKFTKSVTNSGASLNALNYELTDDTTGNATKTTNALSTDSKGFMATAEETGTETGENFVEGSANIAQRPIKVEKEQNLDVTLYWKLPQKDLYTALLNILVAEKNSSQGKGIGRGLAIDHTIKDLDLSFSIDGEKVEKNNDQPLKGNYQGKTEVTLTIGDTNYVLDGTGKFDVNFETLRIRATYYNKSFTGFDVRIEKIDAAGNSVGPLTSKKGLTFKVLKQTNGVLDPNTDYATNKQFEFVGSDNVNGYFRGTYDQLPLLGNGELYVFQMYEYGVPLERK